MRYKEEMLFNVKAIKGLFSGLCNNPEHFFRYLRAFAIWPDLFH